MSEEQFDKQTENVDVAIESTLEGLRAVLHKREVATIAKMAERARLQSKRITELEKQLAQRNRSVYMNKETAAFMEANFQPGDEVMVTIHSDGGYYVAPRIDNGFKGCETKALLWANTYAAERGGWADTTKTKGTGETQI